MRFSSAFHRWLLVFAALVAVLSCGGEACAGTLQIRDDEHTLAAGDTARLRSAVASAPFDARLLFTSETPDPRDLSHLVGALVNEPNSIAIGVDPKHRHVEVHFGTGSGIARADWPSIEAAGDGAFRSGDWEGGAEAIVRMAAQSVTAGPSPLAPAAPHSSFFGSGVFLFLLVAGGVAAAALWSRRRTAYDNGSAYGYGPRPFQGPYGGPPQQGGLGPMGGGLIGAGLGGLAGYELGKMEGEREERGPDGERGNDRTAPSDDGFDAGGGGSSWDDGGSSGGGFDGGGNDGGGGSDF